MTGDTRTPVCMSTCASVHTRRCVCMCVRVWLQARGCTQGVASQRLGKLRVGRQLPRGPAGPRGPPPASGPAAPAGRGSAPAPAPPRTPARPSAWRPASRREPAAQGARWRPRALPPRSAAQNAHFGDHAWSLRRAPAGPGGAPHTPPRRLSWHQATAPGCRVWGLQGGPAPDAPPGPGPRVPGAPFPAPAGAAGLSSRLRVRVLLSASARTWPAVARAALPAAGRGPPRDDACAGSGLPAPPAGS